MNEMAIETGINDKNNYQGKSDWSFYQKPGNKKYIRLLKKDIGSKKYKLYKTDGIVTSYFLISENNKYIGRIQIDKINKDGYIKTSHGTIKNFYQIMFTLLVPDYRNIYSDVSLSTQAIKSYEKLAGSGTKLFKINIKDTRNKIHKFNKELLLQYPGNVVQISESQKGFVNEHFKDYYTRIKQNQGVLPGVFKQMFISGDTNLDLFLFGKLEE